MIQKLQYNIFKTIKPTSKNFVKGNYKPIKKENIHHNLNIIGKIPPDINGIYLRNGPNSINKKINHWFDGDGMIHSINLNSKNNTAKYQNIFIKTNILNKHFSPFTLSALQGLQGFFILALEILFNQSKNDSIGSTANTSIIWHNNYLLALNDNDLPYILNLDNHGIIHNLHKINLPLKSISSHPKKDIITNELFFINYNFLKKPYIQIGSLHNFNITWLLNIDIKPTVMHDFAITQNYIILLDFSLKSNIFNMISGKSIIHFNSNINSRIGIIKKKESSQSNTIWFNLNKSCACFHIINSFEFIENNNTFITLFICEYNYVNIDFDNKSTPHIYKYILDITNNIYTSECISKLPLEFPCINQKYIGYKNKYAWLSHINTYHFDSIVKINLDTNKIVGYINFPDYHFGGETIFIQKQTSEEEDDGFLLIYLHDEFTNKTSLYIYDALTMNNTPITIVEIPARIPFGLHGTFIPQDHFSK